MPTVDLVYAEDCPNVALARANLLQAFSRVGLAAHWTEHRIDDPSAPSPIRGYGSPTILVDGRDVAGLEPGMETSCCRLYAGADGMARAPGVETIVEVLRESVSPRVAGASPLGSSTP